MQTYTHYKDSGIDWIGQIPEHWEVNKLKYFSKIKSITNRTEEELLSVYLDKGVINFNEVDAKRTNVTSLDLSKYQLVEVGDFVLNNQQAWRGSVGVSKYKGIVSPAYIVLDLIGNFNLSYANYFFRDINMVSNYLINSKGVGTIQRNLYWPSLKEVLIYSPPIHEQQSIANFLDEKTAKIDALVQTKEQQIEKLKELRQAKIHQAVTKGLDANAPTKNSGVELIGEIPAHWEVKRLKHLMRINNGLDYKHVQVDEGYPVIGSGGQFAYASNYLYDGEVLFLGRKGTIDKPLYYKGKFWTVDTMFYCVVNNMGITKYLYYFSTTIPFKYYSTATALPSMTQGDLNNHNIPTPPIQEQEQIVAYLDEVTGKIDQAIDQKQEQITKLKEYKQSLINDVVTGKVKVC